MAESGGKGNAASDEEPRRNPKVGEKNEPPQDKKGWNDKNKK